jgi:hypothetical protein
VRNDEAGFREGKPYKNISVRYQNGVARAIFTDVVLGIYAASAFTTRTATGSSTAV